MRSCTSRAPRSAPLLRVCWSSPRSARRSRPRAPGSRHAPRPAKPPARALKGGDEAPAAVVGKSWIAGLALLLVGAVLARLPPLGGLPFFGYAAIAALLLGAVLLVPRLTVWLLRIAPRANRLVPDTALAQLRDNIALSTLSLASVIVSFSLMVAMAIMVYSFRVSFEDWLGKLLPADLQLREALGNDTAYWSPQDQQAAAALPGVARVEFRRTRPLLLDPRRPPVTLIARGSSARQVGEELPLLQSFRGRRTGRCPSGVDLRGRSRSLRLSSPARASICRSAEQVRHFTVAGIWRDYARAFGAVVITRPAYIAATHDQDANEGSVWLKPGSDPAHVEPELRAALARGACGRRHCERLRRAHEHGAARAVAAHLRSRVCDHLWDSRRSP